MAGLFSRRSLLLGGLVAAAGGGYAAYRLNPGIKMMVDNTIDPTVHNVGVVEVGSGGPKWSVLKFSPRAWTEGFGADRYGGVQRASRYNRSVVKSGDIEVDVRDPDKVEDVITATKAAVELLEEEEVSSGRRVIVGSSSIARLPPEHLQKLVAAFADADLPFSMVNAAEEAEYAFRWLVAKADRDRATFIDIGSGNIKGGRRNQETDGEFVSFEIPDGISSLMHAAEALPETTSIQERMAAVVAERVTPHLEVLKHDGIVNERMYMSGGAVWALRCVVHPNVSQEQPWVKLTAADIDRYHGIVTDDPTLDTLIADEPPNSNLRRRIRDLHEAIPQANRILASAEVLSAMSRVFEYERTPHLYFADEGQFAWSTMYLLARLGLEPEL